jgi:hypothetical protein
MLDLPPFARSTRCGRPSLLRGNHDERIDPRVHLSVGVNRIGHAVTKPTSTTVISAPSS